MLIISEFYHHRCTGQRADKTVRKTFCSLFTYLAYFPLLLATVWEAMNLAHKGLRIKSMTSLVTSTATVKNILQAIILLSMI